MGEICGWRYKRCGKCVLVSLDECWRARVQQPAGVGLHSGTVFEAYYSINNISTTIHRRIENEIGLVVSYLGTPMERKLGPKFTLGVLLGCGCMGRGFWGEEAQLCKTRCSFSYCEYAPATIP
eukprot:1131503-Rhodomonas_salina.1